MCLNVCQPILFFMPARIAAGRIPLIFASTIQAVTGCLPFGARAREDPVVRRCVMHLSFHSHKSAATSSDNGMGLPRCRRLTVSNNSLKDGSSDVDRQIPEINILPLQGKQFAASQSGRDIQQHHYTKGGLQALITSFEPRESPARLE